MPAEGDAWPTETPGVTYFGLQTPTVPRVETAVQEPRKRRLRLPTATAPRPSRLAPTAEEAAVAETKALQPGVQNGYYRMASAAPAGAGPSYLVWGLGAAAVLGVGYLLFRKKKKVAS
jgi:hypothetical protein